MGHYKILRIYALRRFVMEACLVICLAPGCGKKTSNSNKVTIGKVPDPNPTVTIAPASDSKRPEFYIDCEMGDDEQSGGSPDAAWKSLTKASATAYPQGGRLFLKRGCTWHDSLTLAASHMDVDAYGHGDLPTLDGSAAISNWTSLGGGLFSANLSLSAGEALGNLTELNLMMSFVPWAGDAVGTLSTASVGSFTYDYATSTVTIKPAEIPALKSYRASVKTLGVKVSGQSDISIRNIRVKRASFHGIQYENCTRCSLRDSEIQGVGGAVVQVVGPNQYIYAGNGIEFSLSSSFGYVGQVLISDVFDSGISPQTYESRQSATKFQFVDVTLKKCGFAGIEISVLSNGGSTESSISDVMVVNASIQDSGRGWSGQRYGTEGHGVRLSADDGAGTVSGIRIERSIIENSAGDGVKVFGEVGEIEMHRLLLHGNGNGVKAISGTAHSLAINLSSSLVVENRLDGIAFNAPAGKGFALRNNTFHNNAGINVAIYGQNGVSKLLNNLFSGAGAVAHFFSAGSLAQGEIDNNCYHNRTNMIGYAGNAYTSLATFATVTNFDRNGIAADDLRLKNAVDGDFHLTLDTPCRERGSAVAGVTKDFEGRPFATPPSSGALEF